MQIPKKWEKNHTQAGLFRKVNKVILFGEEKSGKSYLASGFPGPIGALDTGEGGIQMYLNKDRDTCLTSTDPAEAADIIVWLCEQARKGEINTVLVDSGTLLWDNTKELAYEKISNERGESARAEFQDWAWIKKPINKALYALMRVPAHVAITAWQNEFRMTQDEQVAKGKTSKTQIKRQNTADLERKYGYLFDLAFSLSRGVDQLLQPDGTYTITFWGGRVPSSIPSHLLYPGRKWEFGPPPKTPQQVYEEVIGWMAPYKEGGGTLTLLDVNENDVMKAWKELLVGVEDELVGKVVRILMSMQTKEDYTRRAQSELGPIVTGMGPEQRKIVQQLIDQRKAELNGKD